MEQTQPGARSREEAPERKGWGIVALFLILHLLMGMKVSTLGPRRPATVGDPMALWGGLFFVLWGVPLVIAARAEERSVLFRIMNGAKRATFIGWAFLAIAAYLLGRYIGIL